MSEHDKQQLPRPSPDLARYQHAIAAALARHGLYLVACYPNGARSPLYPNWQNYKLTLSQVEQMWNPTPNPYEPGAYCGQYTGAAVGISCGPSNLLVIDDDTSRHGLADSFTALAQRHGDDLANVPTVATPRGGTHFYFRNDHAADPLGNGTGSLPPKIDVRGKGGYVFAPASLTTFGRYGDLHPQRILDAPPVPNWLREMLRVHTSSGTEGGVVSCSLTCGALEELREPLRHIDPDCSRQDWALVLAAIHKHTNGSGDGLALAHEWSSSGRKYREVLDGDKRDGATLLDYYWPRFDADKGTISGLAYLRNLAINNGWRPTYATTPVSFEPSRPLSKAEYRKQRDEAIAQALAIVRERTRQQS